MVTRTTQAENIQTFASQIITKSIDSRFAEIIDVLTTLQTK